MRNRFLLSAAVLASLSAQAAAQDSDAEVIDPIERGRMTDVAPAEPQPEMIAPGEEDEAQNEPEQTTQPTDERVPVQEAGLSAEDLMGMRVYGANNEDIGSVEDVLVSPEGEVDGFVIDVGGFLGIGGKEVAVAFANLFIIEQNGQPAVQTSFSERQLEEQPEFDEEAYGEGDVGQLMRSQ